MYGCEKSKYHTYYMHTFTVMNCNSYKLIPIMPEKWKVCISHIECRDTRSLVHLADPGPKILLHDHKV